MQRQILHGIPYNIDSQHRVFCCDQSPEPLHIGTYDPATKSVSLKPDAIDQLTGKLAAWRASLEKRARKPTVAAAPDSASSDEEPGAD